MDRVDDIALIFFVLPLDNNWEEDSSSYNHRKGRCVEQLPAIYQETHW